MRKVLCLFLSGLFLLASCSKGDPVSSTGFDDPKSSQTLFQETYISESVTETDEKSQSMQTEESLPDVTGNTPVPTTTKAPATTTTPSLDGLDPAKRPPATPIRQILFTSDLSRAQLADVGSASEGDYVYYKVTSEPKRLVRQKIGSQTEEVLFNGSVHDFKVLNGKLYYSSLGNLYRSDADGKNPVILDSCSAFSDVEVGGNWVFYKKEVGKITQLHTIKTDGTGQQRITTEPEATVGSSIYSYGFNRGYYYVEIAHTSGTYFQQYFHSQSFRIDCRAATLTIEELHCNADYSFNGRQCYSYYMGWQAGENILCYDRLVQKTNYTDFPRHYVTLLEPKGYPLLQDSYVLLKDYIVYLENNSDSPLQSCTIVFQDIHGVEKRFTPFAEFTDIGKFKVTFCENQGVHQNRLLLDIKDNGTDTYRCCLVDANGVITMFS